MASCTLDTNFSVPANSVLTRSGVASPISQGVGWVITFTSPVNDLWVPNIACSFKVGPLSTQNNA